MLGEMQQLEAAIEALEAQRGALGDAVVEALLGPARARLAALSTAAETETQAGQALRQVSILFLDVVGSTTLSQGLGPEAISAVMDDALARGTAIVRTHRGRVLQYAGDNILAAFGADEAREDDAELAVRCGLALLKLGRVLGAEVLQAHGHAGFDFRVGIHTGGVLLGGGVAEGSIRGMAVNIAARMEQTAPAGGLRISRATQALVRDRFEMQQQPPLQVKGLDEPVVSYLVARPVPRPFHAAGRGIEGVSTRMVGRDAELATLQSALERVQLEGRLQVVTVLAEAGIGKSRLLHEFERGLDASGASCLVLRGRCTPASPMQPYGLLRQLLAGAWGLRDDDPLPQAQARVLAGVAPLFEADDGADAAEAHAHLLGHLLGIDHGQSRHIAGIRQDAGQIRARAWHAGLQWFHRTAARQGRPLLLLLEDLHWADDGSLDFLAELARRHGDVPLMLLALARPGLRERRPGWPGDTGVAQRLVELRPLDAQASEALLDELLQRLDAPPPGLRQRLADSAEGNPFYLEELVKMLLDQGALRRDGADGRWRVDAARLRLTQLPATLTGVLQARLDTLRATERRALQEASVIGPLFWAQALAALDTQSEAELPALVRKALTLPRRRDGSEPGDVDDGLREYTFSHQLLHQVTYDTVLQRLRRELHGRVARWLAGLEGARAGDFLALTAEHFERAGESGPAIVFHHRAAEHARDRFAHLAVLHHTERALALLGDDPPDPPTRRWDLHFLRARTFVFLGRHADAGAAQDALDREDARVDDARRAYARLIRAESCAMSGDREGLERLAAEGEALAERAGHADHRLRGLFLGNQARTMRGDFEGCIERSRLGLEEARRLDRPLFVAAFVNGLAVARMRQGADAQEILALMSEAVEATRRSGDRRNEIAMRINVATVRVGIGQFGPAWDELRQALQVARAVGSAVHVAYAQSGMAQVALARGELETARTLAREAAAAMAAVRNPEHQAIALATLGDVELRACHWAAAEQAYGQSLEVATQAQQVGEHRARAGLAAVALARGDLAAALAQVQALEAVDEATLEATGEARWIEWTGHRVWAAAGDTVRARRWLARAHAAVVARRERLADPQMARDYIEGIPHHAAIVAAWEASGAGAG